MIHIYLYLRPKSKPLYTAIDYRLDSWAPATSNLSNLELRYFRIPVIHPGWQLLGTVPSLPVTPELYPELFL